MPVKWWDWWKVLLDDERQQWVLDPFVSVGPLRFGMSSGEVSQALSGVTGESQRPGRPHGPIVDEGAYPEFGLNLYYRYERLAGVVVNACLGPQVFADGVAVVGRVPSVLERWLEDRAVDLQNDGECTYMGPGVPGSDSLGAWIGVQRVGDHLLTRPIFVSYETMDDLSHFLPSDVWSACNPY